MLPPNMQDSNTLLGISILSQQVQSRTSQNESTLILRQSMVNRNDKLFASLLLGNTQLDLALATSLQHIIKTNRVNLITSINTVIVLTVSESKRHNTLLLQVRLVDTGKALRN